MARAKCWLDGGWDSFPPTSALESRDWIRCAKQARRHVVEGQANLTLCIDDTLQIINFSSLTCWLVSPFFCVSTGVLPKS
jgi:hypothetical protein